MGAILGWLFEIMRQILTDLATRDTRGRDTDEFDISAVVYSTGSRNIRTVAYQNRHGEISALSSPVAVGLCHWAVDALLETATYINGRLGPDHRPAQDGVSLLAIETGENHKKLSCEMRSMSDMVGVMVPLSCVDPNIANGIREACYVGRSNILPELHKAAKKDTVFARFHNGLPKLDELNILNPPHSRPLSQSFLVPFGMQTPAELGAPDSRAKTSTRGDAELYASKLRREKIRKAAVHWAVDESAISVRCLGYTISVMTGCGLLVIGGLMAGFLVGSRIEGVDPFNLTMFAWIIAGFIILLAKSLRVAEWPWRDFLKGRVTCRSVQDLACATRLNEQEIIMHLLSLEDEMPLSTKGPYDSVFSGTSGVGFSIDVQPKIGTLVASGLLVIEVLTEQGPALVCLDTRERIQVQRQPWEAERLLGDSYAEMTQLCRSRVVHSQSRGTSWLVCLEPPGEVGGDIVFQWRNIGRQKIIGLYNDAERPVK